MAEGAAMMRELGRLTAENSALRMVAPGRDFMRGYFFYSTAISVFARCLSNDPGATSQRQPVPCTPRWDAHGDS